MAHSENVRTSLEIGFGERGLPERYTRYRGRLCRAVPALNELPFEDAQFEVVILAGEAVSSARVREVHRVLKPNGRMFFTVPEKTGKQDGYTMPNIYAIVREGFNITEVERPAWWYFGRRGRTLSIVATKKVWKVYRGLATGGAYSPSPFSSK